MKKRVLAVILLAAGGLSEIVVRLCMDDIIIQYGISLYRTILMAANILIAAGVIFAGASILFMIKERKSMKLQKTDDEKKKALEKDSKAFLSVKKELNASGLKMLVYDKYEKGNIPFIKDVFRRCWEQMNKMDVYQEKLNNLITSNGADGLEDSKDVLNKTEQYICKNVRKMLNLLEVSDLGNPVEDKHLEAMFNILLQDNGEKLQNADDFLHAVVEFLNGQGDSKEELEMMEIYKNTILEVLKEEKE